MAHPPMPELLAVAGPSYSKGMAVALVRPEVFFGAVGRRGARRGLRARPARRVQGRLPALELLHRSGDGGRRVLEARLEKGAGVRQEFARRIAECSIVRELQAADRTSPGAALHGNLMGGAAFCFAFGGRRAGASRRGH